jgi:peptidoglycan/LPS O-acetylase OafA/YrhL
MTQKPKLKRRVPSTAALVVLGGAIAAATWVSGDHGFAIGLAIFYAISAVIAYVLAGGKGDVAALMRVQGDERQRSIDREAIAWSGMAMSVVAITGTIVQLFRSEDPGQFSIVCAVGGASYVVALAVLRKRR